MLSIFDGLRDITLASVAFRLILSTLCGGIVGMEREFKRRSAGFRTHILICLGAAMTTLTSEFWLVYMRYYLDAARLGAGVVAGMGFIGAGTIIVTRRQRVKGLTTAAGLWTVAIVGLAIGAVTPAEIAVSICAQLVEHRRALPETEYPGTLLEQTNSDLSAIRYLAENAEPKALLLVLTSTGSTPVKSGSLMSVNKLGTGYGTIGGGCSEAAAMQRARKIIGTDGSCVIEIDMTNDVAADEGMVCGGTMRVLIEDASENKT